ncbi:glycosyltransferase family 4 protein [Microvirga solisilvae]|uniref:glycosyltransferase family 4 protein n=1 Tax=Microvirga solisilvae TaxID=2919498 RepID=UPI001FAE9FD9
MSRQPHVVSIVMNGVEGDSRVIKTAQAAMNAGYRATIVGVTFAPDTVRREIEGVPVVLLPHFATELMKFGLWGGSSERDPRLLIGGHLQVMIPEIVRLAPDLLHSHDMIGLKLGAAAAQVMAMSGRSVPWIHDVHEFVAGLTGEAASYMPACLGYEREYLHKADYLFTVSEPLADELEQRYVLPSRPTVTYNAPNKGTFDEAGADIRSTLGLASDLPLVAYVGRATRLRGCDAILDAIMKLDGVHLCFVSQGSYVEGLKAKAAKAGFGDRVHLLPYLPSHQVTTFIRTADVGIHGLVHYPNGEVAMPNKMFEYLHAKLPIVVSDVAAMKQFVESNNIGTTFIAQDADSCAVAIRQALDGAGRFRSNITDELIDEYSWEAQERKIQNVYRDLLGAPKTVTLAARDNAAIAQRLDEIEFEARYGRCLAQINFKTGIRLNSILGPVFAERVRFLREKTSEEGILRTARFVGSRLLKVVKRG